VFERHNRARRGAKDTGKFKVPSRAEAIIRAGAIAGAISGSDRPLPKPLMKREHHRGKESTLSEI